MESKDWMSEGPEKIKHLMMIIDKWKGTLGVISSKMDGTDKENIDKFQNGIIWLEETMFVAYLLIL